MADPPIKIWFCVEGEPGFSSVLISTGDTVEDLRQQIYDKDASFTQRGLTPRSFTLTKVRYIMIHMRTLMY